jgi:hypothetical protein
MTVMLKLTIYSMTHSRHDKADDFDQYAEMFDFDYDILPTY